MFNNSKKPLLVNIYGHLTSFIVPSVADDVDDAIFPHVLCSEPTEKVAKKNSPKKIRQKTVAKDKGLLKKNMKKKGTVKKVAKKKRL